MKARPTTRPTPRRRTPAPVPPSPGAALARADGLRDGNAEDRAAALAAYADHAAAIDPATPEGDARVRWLLTLGRALDPRLEDVLRRASTTSPDTGVREAAEVVLFQFPYHRGDLAAAEAHLRALLRRFRGTDNLREVGVVNDLALVYQAGGREFEVLMLARRGHRLASAHHHSTGIAIARARLAWALERLGEWDDLARNVGRLEMLVPHLEPWHHGPARRVVHTARRAVRFAAGDFEGARREHALVLRAGPPPSPETDDAFDGALLEARIALAEDRPGDAATIARKLAKSKAVGTPAWLAAMTLLTRALVASGDRDAAASTAAPLLHALRTAPRPGVGASVLLDVATSVGDALGEHPGAGPFFEAASELLMRRIGELHECVASVDELSDAADQDRELLARHRSRFVSEQCRALDAIAAIHEDPDAPRPPELERLAEDGRLRICAWCLTMKTPDGRVLPVGHLIPGSVRLRVTHGVCDRCRVDLPD